jgi:hypothetical protein
MDNKEIIEQLDRKALYDTTVKASKVGRYDLGDSTILDQIPMTATAVAAWTYMEEMGLLEAHAEAMAKRGWHKGMAS